MNATVKSNFLRKDNKLMKDQSQFESLFASSIEFNNYHSILLFM